MTKVSVIVPVYNVEKCLSKCLDSLINQEFEDYEIIVVNDGSPDNSQSIIDEYSKLYPDKIKAFKKENGGQASARNLGIKNSIGNYLCFVDSDDYVTTDYIKVLYEKALIDNSDIVICDMQQITGDETIIIKGLNKKTNDIFKNFILSPPGPTNKLFKRELFEKDIEFLEGLYYEDLGTIPKLVTYANIISYVEKPLYVYVIRMGSTMKPKNFTYKLKDIYAVLDSIYDFFETKGILNKYYSEIEYLFINQLLYSFGLKFISYPESQSFIKDTQKIIKDKFPKFRRNKYFKNENFKKRVMCELLFQNRIKLINFLKKG